MHFLIACKKQATTTNKWALYTTYNRIYHLEKFKLHANDSKFVSARGFFIYFIWEHRIHLYYVIDIFKLEMEWFHLICTKFSNRSIAVVKHEIVLCLSLELQSRMSICVFFWVLINTSINFNELKSYFWPVLNEIVF